MPIGTSTMTKAKQCGYFPLINISTVVTNYSIACSDGSHFNYSIWVRYEFILNMIQYTV